MEDTSIAYGHSVYFMALWYILWSIVNFPRFGIVHLEKSGNPEHNHRFSGFLVNYLEGRYKHVCVGPSPT
jgi:hypothetical protein